MKYKMKLILFSLLVVAFTAMGRATYQDTLPVENDSIEAVVEPPVTPPEVEDSNVVIDAANTETPLWVTVIFMAVTLAAKWAKDKGYIAKILKGNSFLVSKFDQAEDLFLFTVSKLETLDPKSAKEIKVRWDILRSGLPETKK